MSSTSPSRRRSRAWLSALTAMLMAIGSAVAAAPASAAPVYELDGRWMEGTPSTVGRGDVVNAFWVVNVNDDAAAPANTPVENVVFSVTIAHGLFKSVPDACAATGVDPVSTISEDGRTLTCNLGPVEQGTAVAVQTPIVANGSTGDAITATGEIAGQQQPLSPIEIRNAFAMDMHFGQNTEVARWNAGATGLTLDLQWSLRLGKGSDPGPNEVTYRLNLSEVNGGAITVGAHTRSGEVGCTPFEFYTAPGHPWSELPGYPLDQQAPFVEECTLTQVAPGQFDLTLRGIDYDMVQVPTKDSAGNPLPTDWNYIASGSLWFDVATNRQGGVTLQSSAPTYVSTTNLTSTDLTANNTTNKTYTLPGAWSAGWDRNWTRSGGRAWDDSYRVAAGTNVRSISTNAYYADTVAPSAMYGSCVALDTRYVTYVPDGVTPWALDHLSGVGAHVFEPTATEYYVGADPLLDPASPLYDPDRFNCGADAGGWTTTQPEDPSDVRAVRILFPFSAFEEEDATYLQIYVQQTVNPDVQLGQDVWMFGSVMRNGGWTDPAAAYGKVLDTPNARYEFTNGRRDILRIIYASPSIQKSVDRAVVQAGEPATFTLTYAANGVGASATVDGYSITDTLPVGMRYVAGSATPEPAVTTDAQGREVLTWTLDDVPTNAAQRLTYQAVAAASVQPGQVLTNTAVSALGGETSPPAQAQVTLATNGYTQVGKTTDQWFIANPDGSGDGEGSWTVSVRSYDPLPSAFTDTIDILPHRGDGRGTDYAGSYAVTSVDVPAGATVYYTTADVASLSDDPRDASNGAAPGDPTGNSVGWSTTAVPNPTAVRVIGGQLAPGETFAFDVNIATDGAEPGDVWVNRAQSIAEHTELVMRTSEPLTMGARYSVSVKKYVQDRDGEWHDANDVADYPVFRDGEDVNYRVVVTNTGQGTLRDVVVADDRQPELGSFEVGELLPGEEHAQTHEYTVTLGEGGADSIVNTACVSAAQPADAEDPVQTSCDPAGIELDGDPQHDKELVSATPMGDGRWELVYAIDVTNASVHPTSYSLDDALRFTEQASVVSATVTGAPEGVTLAEPAWDGREAVRIASGVPLLGSDDDGYAAHSYEVTVVADVPLQLEGAGTADDPTLCGAEGDEASRAFSNTTTLTDARGETEDDRACAPIPSIDVDKAVASGPTPNGDGTWTVVYDIVATNAGAAEGVYTASDRMTADGDLVVESGRVVATPDGVTASPAWTGLGAEQSAAENVIAADVALPAGGVHTYRVEVVVSVDAEGLAPVITSCSADPGQDGGLSNTAQVEHNDLVDDASACVTLASITVDKTVASGPTPNGDGTWSVEYAIVAENVGAAAGEYDVFDRLRFGDGIAIEQAEVVAPEGVTAQEGWTGLGADAAAAENLVAADVSLDAGASHTYAVRVVVSLDESVVTPADLACPTPGSAGAGGLANGTLLDHNGIEAIDAVCPTLPLIAVDKSIADGPVANGDGTWSITYDLVATNTGAAAGEYDLVDELQYGAGVEVVAAEVVTAPDGVRPSEAWTGLGAAGSDENVVAAGVSLEADGTHTYQVEVRVALDVETVTAADLACPAPSSGERGALSNSVTLTHNGEQRRADACAPLPLIEVTKSLSGAVVPVDGEPGQYDATYRITVLNSGPAAGEYDLGDAWTTGTGVTVVGVRDVSTDAPDSVGLNPGFGSGDDTRIVSAQPIAAAAEAAPVMHTYTVVVRYAVELSQVESPTADSCGAGAAVPDGALVNTAAVTWNGISDEDDACVLSGKPTLDKELVLATPIGEGRWEVVYELTVGNTGVEPTGYDLDDELLFAPAVAVEAVAVEGPDGIELDGAFDGAAHERIATDVTIAGLDDEGYAPHVYRVTVTVGVPLQLEPATADGTGAPGCTAPAGDNLLEQGLNNAATLTDETGGTVTDTDCAPLPSIAIEKSIVGEPTVDAEGVWTIEYELVARNDGAEAGAYALTDRLRYGAGIAVVDAVVTESPEGVVLADAWTGLGAEGADENVVATGELAAGTAHTYRVVVTATVDAEAADASTSACPATGADADGGFANTAGIEHNGLVAIAAACAAPEAPGAGEAPGVPPLTDTATTTAAGVIGAALLLLLAGGVLLARRRVAEEA